MPFSYDPIWTYQTAFRSLVDQASGTHQFYPIVLFLTTPPIFLTELSQKITVPSSSYGSVTNTLNLSSILSRMNEQKNRKERTERKRSLGDVNRLTMAMAPRRSEKDAPAKRPSRACSSRLPPRLSQPSLPAPLSTPKSSIQEQPARTSASRTGVRAVSLVLSSSLSPVQKERSQLRSMWQLAAIVNFFNIFRPILNLGPEFSLEELEYSLLSPNHRLDTIHIALLKGIPPAARIPLTSDTWPIVLCKKFKDWWARVAEGQCPLVPSQGGEPAAYREFDTPTRVRVLMALCEIRSDQDDVRLYIDESLKHGYTLAAFRKDRIGCGAEGTTFWFEDDPVMGQRLYREGHTMMKSKGKGWGKGRNVPPPIPGTWETVATTYEEFQEVAERLLGSRNRMEGAMGKKITQNIMPQLEEIQKKKDRTIKKQQRQAVLLDNLIQGNGLAAGRSRRERKPVTYTFDEFDRSISEAIKFTKKSIPEPTFRRDPRFFNNGVNGLPGNAELGHDGKERNGSVGYGEGVVNGGASRRQLRSSHQHLGDEGVDPASVEVGAGFSDDEIEGEAVYDDDYVAAKQQKDSFSSEGGEEHRDDQDDADFEGEGDRNAEDSDEYKEFERGDSDGSESEEHGRKRQKKGPKVRLVNDLQREGNHRNKRPDSSRARNSGDDESDFEEKVEIDGFQQLSEPRVPRHRGAEKDYEEPSDDDVSDYLSERDNGKQVVSSEEERENGDALPMEDEIESDHHSEERSAQSESAYEQEEGESVDFDDENVGQEVENDKGSGGRRQMLDLNEVATGTRGQSPSFDNEESDYSGDERAEEANGAQAGSEVGSKSNRSRTKEVSS